MRPTILACLAGALACAIAVPAAPARAQQDVRPGADTLRDPGVLPREVAREVTDVYNAPATTRVSGLLDLPADRTVEGDLAVLGGPATVAGRVTGRLVAINADVALRPGARIDGDLIVVGGAVAGWEEAAVGGEVRVYRAPLDYRQEGERLTPQGEEDAESFWRRWRERRRSRHSTDLQWKLVTARTYNRVEGLPVQVGPRVRWNSPVGVLRVEAYGIVRTADDAKWDTGNIGHDLRAELRPRRGPGVGVGGRLYDVVEAMESWQLPEEEVGLAAFFMRRDYRDYFDRHGGMGYVTLAASGAADLTLGLADETWGARRARPVWSLFRGADGWRSNPLADGGRFHLATAALRYDTRNDPDDPWSGWFLSGEYEHGRGVVASFARTSPGVRDTTDRSLSYGRVLLDLRRYNRLTKHTQLDFRAVYGGWAGGDPLPLQRRLSATGPGVLPGFEFRRSKGADTFTCSPVGSPSTGQPSGRPAQCDRVAVAQVEYRGDVRLDLLDWGDDADDHRVRRGLTGALEYLFFFDMGRGWLLGAPAPGAGSGSDDLYYDRGRPLPPLSTFNADVGAGLSFHGFGVYVAKPLSEPDDPANVFVRVRRRF